MTLVCLRKQSEYIAWRSVIWRCRTATAPPEYLWPGNVSGHIEFRAQTDDAVTCVSLHSRQLSADMHDPTTN